MRVQLAWTMLTEILVTVSGILLLKLAASMLGPTGFGEYALSRRAAGLLYLPLVMGLGIAAPRYIAIARADAMAGYSAAGFAAATLTVGLLPAMAVVALFNLFPALASTIVFGTTTLDALVRPATLVLAGLTLHNIVYAVYRGQGRMGCANVLQAVNLAAVPLAAFAMADRGAGVVLLATGTAWLLFGGAALFHIATSVRSSWTGGTSVRDHMKILLRFGIPRIPGEFALMGLFAIPALIAVRVHGIVIAGQFSAAISILTIAAGVFAPVGLVLLPRASAQVATGDLGGLRRLVVKILVGGILLAIAGVAAGELLAPTLVRWYFGEAFVPSVPIFRACLAGAVPYVIYVLMRNILDALNVKAVNSRNLLISLGVLIALCLADTGIMWMAGSLVGSLSVLGALTLRDTWLYLRTGPASESGTRSPVISA